MHPNWYNAEHWGPDAEPGDSRVHRGEEWKCSGQVGTVQHVHHQSIEIWNIYMVNSVMLTACICKFTCRCCKKSMKLRGCEEAGILF